MSLPADGVNANTLAETTTIPTGKKLIFLDPDTNEGGIITLENLTKQILSNLTSQTFNLDQGNKTLLAALNELNSKAVMERKINSSFADIENERTGFYVISYGDTTPSSDPGAPDTSVAAHFWFVIHVQRFATRKLEIAISPFRKRNTLYFRTYHDKAWYGWYALTGADASN